MSDGDVLSAGLDLSLIQEYSTQHLTILTCSAMTGQGFGDLITWLQKHSGLWYSSTASLLGTRGDDWGYRKWAGTTTCPANALLCSRIACLQVMHGTMRDTYRFHAITFCVIWSEYYTTCMWFCNTAVWLWDERIYNLTNWLIWRTDWKLDRCIIMQVVLHSQYMTAWSVYVCTASTWQLGLCMSVQPVHVSLVCVCLYSQYMSAWSVYVCTASTCQLGLCTAMVHRRLWIILSCHLYK